MISGFGFASFAMWARKCAGAGLPTAYRGIARSAERQAAAESLFHTASAHFLASIARSACTAVYPKLELT